MLQGFESPIYDYQNDKAPKTVTKSIEITGNTPLAKQIAKRKCY